MTREETKERIAVMQAYVNHKKIEYYDDTMRRWLTVVEPTWGTLIKYRIKPEDKYRPFANADECWQEMQKHKPFGWIKKISGHCNFLYIMGLYSTGIVINDVDIFGGFKNLLKTYNFAFAETTFADGTPFGIKED